MGLKKIGLCVMTIVLSAGIASAQSTTGTISGHVSDTQGLALPGVTVSIVTEPSEHPQHVTSVGDYVMTLLPPITRHSTYRGQKREKRSSLPTRCRLPAARTGVVDERVTVIGAPAHVLGITRSAQS